MPELSERSRYNQFRPGTGGKENLTHQGWCQLSFDKAGVRASLYVDILFSVLFGIASKGIPSILAFLMCLLLTLACLCLLCNPSGNSIRREEVTVIQMKSRKYG